MRYLLKFRKSRLYSPLKFSATEDLCLDSVIVHQGILQTTADICRVISRLDSHLLIVGLAGSGKLECIHISCTYLNIKLMTITPSKNYAIDDFFSDLKMVTFDQLKN